MQPSDKDDTKGLVDDEKLLARVKYRYQVMYDADHENRLAAMDDIKFANVPGWQWDENMKQERGTRPCLEINKIRVSGKRIINDIRANRPQGKVRAVEGGDVETAEINEGLCRNIWNTSDADTVTDYAGEYQVSGGMGCWRVVTEYSDDTAFDQDIVIEGIQNPFTLYWDPSARDPQKRDAADWILTEKISEEEYKTRWPKAQVSNFEDSIEFDDDEDWNDEVSVRIAEYWWKEPHKKEIWEWRKPDGETAVVDSESDEAAGIDEDQILRRREVMTHKIMYCVVSGAAVLDQPQEWAGRKFPFVVVFGEYMYIDGRPYWWGLPRFAKDAQRQYNITRTNLAERIAQASKSPYWATEKQAKGLTNQWTEAHKKNLPFMLYNNDPQVPGPPVRMGAPDIPIALIQESQIASEEIKAVTGIFDPSLGNTSNETSGRAIFARQQQGEIATFNYQDNMAKGVRHTYEILIDLIPEIYDTERELRILGSDGAEDYVRVNTIVTGEDGEPVRVNDLSTGRYDVTVTVGPSFSTLRQEASETYANMGQQFPDLWGVAGDLVMKSMDLPYADDIADRLKTLLPPQIQQQMNEGKDMPPEVMEAMAQADMAMQQVQQHGQLVQAAAQELETDKSDHEKLKADIRAEMANIRAAKAEFDAHMAEEFAKLIEKETGLVVRHAELKEKGAEVKEAAASLGSEKLQELVDVQGVSGVVSTIDEVLAGFMGSVDVAMNSLADKAQQIEQKADRQPVGGMTRREGGKLVADIEYDDGSTRSVSAVRDKGGLRIVPPDAEV